MPSSLRCAKLGVARVETASPNARAAAPYMFLRIIIDLLPMRPTSRGNAPGWKSLAATARQSRKPAGRDAQERLQNRHVTRAVRGMWVGALARASGSRNRRKTGWRRELAAFPSPLWGGVRGGGRWCEAMAVPQRTTPLPNPPPQGERE